MATTLKTMATLRLMMLLFIFLFGNSFYLIPADPASAGWTGLYPPVAVLSGSLLLTTIAAATILLYARRMARRDEARELLLLAVGLSAVSALLAVCTFEFGYRYRIGHGTVVNVLPGWVCMLFILGLEHGFCAGFQVAMSI